MSAVPPDFQQVIELASLLTPEEQSRLVVRIGENLTAVLSGKDAIGRPAGSAAAVLARFANRPTCRKTWMSCKRAIDGKLQA